MSAFLLDDHIIHYESLGRGRPVMFLHGWVGSWRYWIPSMQVASMSYRAYALDFWGFGDTSRSVEHYKLDQQICLIDQFLDKMGIQKIALVGHGLGALAALFYAQRHPDRVDRLMAVAYPWNVVTINTRLLSDTPQALASWLLDRNSQNEDIWADALKADERSSAFSLNDVNDEMIRSALMSLQTPCLMVYGVNDKLVQPLVELVLNTLPEMTHCIIFEQSGHFLMLDNNNRFNRLMLDFLELKSGESPRQLQLKEMWKRKVR